MADAVPYEVNIMTAKLFTGAAVAVALVFAGAAAHAQSKASSASQTFITEAIQGNLAEVEMGKLAQTNGASESVRTFGRMLEQDHAVANQKAIQAAQSLGVTPPTAPSQKQKADHDHMAKMTGAQFDSAFIKDMVADHKKDVSDYQNAAKGNDAAATYAKDALPTLQKHLSTAESLSRAATTGSR
jgi:putative membrane protein